MLYFGTDGIRAHQTSLFFTSQSIALIGQALALWSKGKGHSSKKILCIHDTRASAPKIKLALTYGLQLEKYQLFDGGILPTPAAHWIMRTSPFDFALILTASHNPAYDNGIKILLPNAKITPEDESIIEHHYSNLLLRSCIPETATIEQSSPKNFQKDAQEKYLQQFNQYVPLPKLHNKKIILDCAHGAMSFVAETLFKPTDATIICINNQPDGLNINQACGAIHPQSLIEKIKEEHADLGFSFDGDGDRVIAVDASGNVKTGDDLLCLLTQHPQFIDRQYIVGTTMSNQGLELHLEKTGKKLIRTNIGDRSVIKAMKKHNALLGGEPGGHIIINAGIPSSDGAAAARWALDTCTERDNYSLHSFAPHVQLTASIKALHKPDFARHPLYQQALEEIRLHLPQGRALIRYSGTEPILRIMVENTEETAAHHTLKKLTTLFQSILS
ncbi:MAG: Phosphoglucosamine mutase [candidate division TM6 bacterium GW2011_GWF2_43_17]|nr:MAG: Phosphoglucosamine mutase [candidate division TM6 bacterium GW2011_GWF2_43_17]